MPPEPPAEEWCLAGTTTKLNTDQVVANARIVGIVEFKGEDWCKSVQEVDASGIKIITTNYYKFAGTEMWIIQDLNGDITETHITQ